MKRTTPELNKVWSRALRAVLMILPLGLSGCFDNKLPPAGSFDLAVSVSGSGQVTSSPAGIACGSDCTETLATGSTITLSATPASGAMFTGWGGDCSGSTPSCTLTMSASRAVTASFTFSIDPPPPAAQYTLSVNVTGSGSVSSSPAGILCPGDCSETLAAGSNLTLTATPASGYTFTGWSGDCSGSMSCTPAMSANRAVTATFSANPPPPAAQYTLSVSVTGSGSVSSSPTGILCPSDCSETLAAGSNIVLSATPASGYTFTGWSGDCSGTMSCVPAMSANRAVTATFTANPPPPVQSTLTVSKSGVGTVTSSSGTINCGSTCSVTVPIATPATSITLSAAAGSGYTFAGWSGAGIACPGTGTCTVSMSVNRNVLASFTNNTAQILFEERFDNPGSNLTFGFDGWLFGYSNQLWTMRDHLLTGGVNNGPAFRATSTFDSFILNDDVSIGNGGTSYYFLKNLSGNLAEHSRDFWVRQCMKHSPGYLDARTRGPIGAKINYFIGSGGGFLDYTPISGTLQAQERVVGQSSGARADIFLPYENTNVRVTNIAGTFQAGETIVGQTSRATATLVSFSPEERTIGFNHFWHPGSAENDFRGDNYQELTWFDLTSSAYFGSYSTVNQVRHNNWLLLQDHYNEWMCLETHFDLDQVPWLVEIYVTTAPGAATLASGTTALDTTSRRQFNDYLYIRYSNPTAPALEPGFGVHFNQYGAYGLTLTNDEIYFDEYLISTGKVGHPFR